MTEIAAERPSPASALEAAFTSILRERMQDMPMVNPALAVEAVGFRPWRDHWLGILVTPWFMNLLLMPRVSAKWQPIAAGETRQYAFPAGVFEFIGARDPLLGDYQACSLFSPMFDFATMQGAHDTALAALEALFDTGSREAGEVKRTDPPPRELSKRDFLFGLPSRAKREP
jgi:[NiFe] hydrogenase assembly HybE family chaperone